MVRIILGGIVTVIGGWLFLATAENNNICHTWVGAFAPAQCRNVVIVHSVGQYIVSVGVVLIAFGIYGVAKSRKARDNGANH